MIDDVDNAVSDITGNIPDTDEAPSAPVPPRRPVDVPPDIRAATMALDRALSSSLRTALKSTATALILVPPTADWCAPIKAAMRTMVGGGWTVDFTYMTPDPWGRRHAHSRAARRA